MKFIHPASDHSFYPLNREVAARVCSQLNAMVQNGLIVLCRTERGV